MLLTCETKNSVIGLLGKNRYVKWKSLENTNLNRNSISGNVQLDICVKV